VQRWKGELQSEDRVLNRVQSTEYRVRSADYGGKEAVSAKVQIGLRPVERCEDEKGVKRGTGDRVQSTEYGVRIIEGAGWLEYGV
jgi:hypothetical protein